MPLVQYCTMSGTFVSQEQATSVASGGTSMQISLFNISQLPVGTYAGFISNAGPNGTWNYLGTAGVSVFDGSVKITGSEKSVFNCTAPQSATFQSGSPEVTCPRLYDSGEVSVTVNGFTVSVAYGQGSTTYTITTALANAFNGASASPVVAFPEGLVLSFQKKVRGTSFPMSATSSTNDPGIFGGPSFRATASGSTI
jgi:hypothetical protein